MTETIVYREQTVNGLFALYVEARETGAKELSEEVWDRLTEIDRHQVNEQLMLLRDELNELIKKDN